jgi:hypothetical protein
LWWNDFYQQPTMVVYTCVHVGQLGLHFIILVHGLSHGRLLNIDDLTNFVMESLSHEKGLGWTNIARNLVAFGIDIVSVFQGVKSSVTKQFERHALC